MLDPDLDSNNDTESTDVTIAAAVTLPAVMAEMNADQLGPLALVEEFDDELAQQLGLTERDLPALVSSLRAAGAIAPNEPGPDGEPGTDAAGWRWQAPFREIVRDEFIRRSPERRRSLELRLVDYFAARSEPGLALAHAMAAADWPAVVKLFESSWRQLSWQHPFETARALLTMPASVLSGHPLVEAVRAIVPGAPVDRAALPQPKLLSPDELEEVGRGAQARLAIDTAIAVSSMYRNKGMLDLAERYGDQLLALMRVAQSADAPRALGLMAGGYQQIAAIHLHRGQAQVALDLLLEGYQLGPYSDQPFQGRLVAGHIALIYALRGDVEQAAGWLDRVEQAPDLTGMFGPVFNSAGNIARALVCADALDIEGCSSALAALDTGPLNPEFWMYAYFARSIFALGWGDRVGLLDELSHLPGASAGFYASARHEGSIASPLLLGIRANLLMSLGRGSQVWAELNGETAHPYLDVSRARLALLSGNPIDALEIAGVVDTDSPRSPNSTRPPLARGSRAALVHMTLISAVALHRLGRDDEAAPTFAAAVAVSSPQRLLPFASVPRADLLALIELIPAAGSLLTPEVLGRLPEIYPTSIAVVQLTRQERLILQALVASKSTATIATELHLAPSTIKTHLRHLYQKLDVNSRTTALAAAGELGLLSWDDAD